MPLGSTLFSWTFAQVQFAPFTSALFRLRVGSANDEFHMTYIALKSGYRPRLLFSHGPLLTFRLFTLRRDPEVLNYHISSRDLA
jgi:hypothetical protein